VLAAQADGGRIDYGQHLFEVAHEQRVEEHLVGLLEPAQKDIAFIVVGQLTEGLQAARDLLVEGSDHRREKAVQVEEVALLVSEGGALVEQRVVEEGITAAVGLYIGTVRI
jgi:hypothetical protein